MQRTERMGGRTMTTIGYLSLRSNNLRQSRYMVVWGFLVLAVITWSRDGHEIVMPFVRVFCFVLRIEVSRDDISIFRRV